MKERYKQIGIVAGLLLVVYALGQLLAWKPWDSHSARVGAVTLGLIGVIMFVATFRWFTRYPSSRAVPDLGLALVIGAVASALLGPFAGAAYPFKTGAGDFFNVIWLFLGVGIGASLLAILLAIAIGKDYRSKALKQFAEDASRKRRTTVRS